MEKFSDKLDSWLRGSSPKTLGGLVDVFREKSLALIFLVLMALPALPLPTGGISHAFELIVLGLVPFFMFGKNKVPKKWQGKKIPRLMQTRTLPFLLRRIRWIERFSKRRLDWILDNSLSNVILGLLIATFTLTAFFAPPFSGLDTLPALGVVLISLGLILEDALVVVAGLLVGSLGIAVIIGIGAAAFNIFKHFF